MLPNETGPGRPSPGAVSARSVERIEESSREPRAIRRPPWVPRPGWAFCASSSMPQASPRPGHTGLAPGHALVGCSLAGRPPKSHDDGGDVGDPRHDSDARDRVTGRSRLSGSRATTAIQGTSPHMVPRTTRASRPACRVRDRTHQPISVIRDLDLRLGQRRWSDGKTAVVVGVAAPVLSGVNCEDAGVLCVSRSRRVLGPQTRPGAGTAPRPLPPPGEEPSSGLYPSDRHLKDATRVRASMRGWWEIPSMGPLVPIHPSDTREPFPGLGQPVRG